MTCFEGILGTSHVFPRIKMLYPVAVSHIAWRGFLWPLVNSINTVEMFFCEKAQILSLKKSNFLAKKPQVLPDFLTKAPKMKASSDLLTE